MQLEVGASVDRYTVCGVLGHGGMATVYRVRHEQLGTFHALKVLTVPSRAIRDRLVQEGRLQASLNHPNIVAVNDVVSIDGAPGLVMELVRGPSLDKVLAAQRLTLAQCDALVPGILAGVAAAHARGLVHRDLKPHNIMLQVTERGLVPKITDFGIAKVMHGDVASPVATRTGAQMGTPAYMAPEQARNAKGVDARADIFALGAILYEMVTGRRAFDGDDLLDILNAVSAGRYPPPRDVVPDLPDRVVRAIEGALVVDRERRIDHCETLLGVWQGDIVASETILLTPRVAGPFDPAFLAQFEAGADTSSPAATPSNRSPQTTSADTFSELRGEASAEPEASEPIGDLLAALDAPTAARAPRTASLEPTLITADVPPSAPVAAPAEDDEPLAFDPGRSRAWLAVSVAAVALLGLGALGLVASGLRPGTGVDAQPVADAPTAPLEPTRPIAPALEPVADPPPTTPLPTTSSRPAPERAPSSAPERVVGEVPAEPLREPAAPVEPATAATAPPTIVVVPPPPSTVAPAPAPPVAAARVVSPPPATTAAPASSSPSPAPSRPATTTTPRPPVVDNTVAHVLLSGSTRVRAVSAAGKATELPADLAPGTYTLFVGTNAGDWTAARTQKFAAGETVTLKCTGMGCKTL